MAGIAFNIVGLVLGNVLGIIPLLGSSNLTPDPLAAGNSLVRIGIGLPSTLNVQSSSTSSNSSGHQTMGGTIPSLRVYNENKEMIGHSTSNNYNTISEGQFTTVTVYQNSSGSSQQAPFLQVAGGTNDLCIAYLGQTWADGTKLGWLGDVGKFCGARWYYSNLFVEMRNGTMYKPYCTWVGGTNRAENPYTGFRIHTPDFGKMGDNNDFTIPSDPASLCNFPSLEWYKTPIFHSAAPSLRPISLLSIGLSMLSLVQSAVGASLDASLEWLSRQEEVPLKESIIGSHDEMHSASELCKDPMAWGPDFVSFQERVFCDMKTKEVWPLCDAEITKSCFDWDTKNLVKKSLSKRETGYAKVEVWK